MKDRFPYDYRCLTVQIIDGCTSVNSVSTLFFVVVCKKIFRPIDFEIFYMLILYKLIKCSIPIYHGKFFYLSFVVCYNETL